MSLVYIPRLRSIGLESVYTDYVICQHRWEHFVSRLKSEWAEFTLYVSVPHLLRCGTTHPSEFIGDRVAERQRGILGHTER